MQAELKERLEAVATAAGRSLNAEIVARLEKSFEGTDTAAFTALAYGLATSEVDKERMKLDIQLLANRLRHISAMFELHVNGKHDAPTDEEFEVWNEEAKRHLQPRTDFAESIQEKLDAVRVLADKMHGVVSRED